MPLTTARGVMVAPENASNRPPSFFTFHSAFGGLPKDRPLKSKIQLLFFLRFCHPARGFLSEQ